MGKWANDGLLDILMAVSRDGVHWSRIVRGPYIPLTPEGKESKSMYMAVGMVRRGDELLQYYAAYEVTHGNPGPHPHPIGSLCAAVQRRDGFVSADFAYGGGSLTTPPMVFDGGRLELNLDCSAMGSAKVELLDGDGKVVAESEVIFGNDVHHVVTWQGKSDVSSLAGKPIRLHIEARAAKLYAFQFVK